MNNELSAALGMQTAEALEEYSSILADRTCDDWQWPTSMPVALRLALVDAFHEANCTGDPERIQQDRDTAIEGGTWSESSWVMGMAYIYRAASHSVGIE
jgi:hypothetical protein